MNLQHRLPWTSRKRAPYVKPSKPAGADFRRFVPRLELLEGRAVPSTFHVTTTADSGPGSLRTAVAAANANPGLDRIVFDPSLSGQTITLTSGELMVTDDLRINGPVANLLSISGNDSSRVFEFAAGTTDTITGVTVTGGLSNFATTQPGAGGGVYSGAALTVVACAIEGNTAEGVGGGIFNTGTLVLRDTTISANNAASGGGIGNIPLPASGPGILTVTGCSISANTSEFGGGVYSEGSATIRSTTLSGNSASFDGGAIYAISGTLTLRDSTISANTATGGAGIRAAAGGIFIGGPATVSRCRVSVNVA